jgi:hypothetical protein
MAPTTYIAWWAEAVRMSLMRGAPGEPARDGVPRTDDRHVSYPSVYRIVFRTLDQVDRFRE